MEEEYQESEVIFSESSGVNYEEHDDNAERSGLSGHSNSRVSAIRNPTKKNYSAPVKIPENVSRNSWFQSMKSDFFDDDRDVEPPHVTVARRILAGKMSSSVCSGKGRTLKGRDLSQVRNSILKMTGFLET